MKALYLLRKTLKFIYRFYSLRGQFKLEKENSDRSIGNGLLRDGLVSLFRASATEKARYRLLRLFFELYPSEQEEYLRVCNFQLNVLQKLKEYYESESYKYHKARKRNTE